MSPSMSGRAAMRQAEKPFLLDAVLSVFIDEMNLSPNAEFQSG
jgi:hypothetical protein